MRKIVDSGILPRSVERLPTVRARDDRPDLPRHLSAPSLDEVCPSARIFPLDLPGGAVPRGYHPMNPSIAAHEGVLFTTIRCVSYELPHGRYGGRSVNLFARLKEDLSVDTVREMEDLDPSPRCKAPSYGYEDMRLFSLGPKGLGASATVLDRTLGKTEIALLTLTRGGDVLSAEVQTTGLDRVEKNWMPVVLPREGVLWIYSVDPTIVRAPGNEAPSRVIPATSFENGSLKPLRGGSQLLETRRGYLAVVHETVALRGVYLRVYLHRLVLFDRTTLGVLGVSARFLFTKPGVEFCAGMARHPLHPSRLVLSFGVLDAEAWLSEVDEEELLNLVV